MRIKRSTRSGFGIVLGLLLIVSACSVGTDDGAATDPGTATAPGTSTAPANASETTYPDVTAVEITLDDDGAYALDVTISSPYDSPERYADGWRVLDEDGATLGEMVLTHDHASEQPFTRTQTGLEIPDDVSTITVEGRDSENGYGGATVDAAVPGR